MKFAIKLTPGVLLAGAMISGGQAAAAPEEYVFDQSHTQILFEYDHFGNSITQGTFVDWSGTLMVDTDEPAASSLDVSIEASSLHTGFADRDTHLKTADFFEVETYPAITFTSTEVSQAGENTLQVTGDMTIHGTTLPVTFDVVVNNLAPHPMSQQLTLGFTATTTVSRTAFGVGMFTPMVGDEVAIRISGEAVRKADM